MPILVTCQCGKKFQVKAELAGKRGKCPACGQILVIPAPKPSATTPGASSSPQKKCPSCHAVLQPKAVLCVNCGLDLRTGKKVSTGAPSAIDDPLETAPEPSHKPPTPRLPHAILFGGIGVAVLVGAAVLYFLVLRTAPFEKAFAAGRIRWEPVSNVEVVTQEGNQRTIQSHNFVQTIQYDENGRGTVSTEGLKTYKWGSREATIGPEAVIRITKDYKVTEGPLKAGDEWRWDGSQWSPKKT